MARSLTVVLIVIIAQAVSVSRADDKTEAKSGKLVLTNQPPYEGGQGPDVFFGLPVVVKGDNQKLIFEAKSITMTVGVLPKDSTNLNEFLLFLQTVQTREGEIRKIHLAKVTWNGQKWRSDELRVITIKNPQTIILEIPRGVYQGAINKAGGFKEVVEIHVTTSPNTGVEGITLKNSSAIPLQKFVVEATP